jgi:hypothetical protein
MYVQVWKGPSTFKLLIFLLWNICNNHLSSWKYDYLSFYDNYYLMVQMQEKFQNFKMGGWNFK